MRGLEFECEDDHDAGQWVQALCSIESVQLLSSVPEFSREGVRREEEDVQGQGVASSQRYPHESEYGGGKNYVSAPYIGGKSIFEPQVGEGEGATAGAMKVLLVAGAFREGCDEV